MNNNSITTDQKAFTKIMPEIQISSWLSTLLKDLEFHEKVKIMKACYDDFKKK